MATFIPGASLGVSARGKFGGNRCRRQSIVAAAPTVPSDMELKSQLAQKVKAYYDAWNERDFKRAVEVRRTILKGNNENCSDVACFFFSNLDQIFLSTELFGRHHHL